MNEQTQNNVTFVTVESDYEGQRIDNFLMRSLRGVPKSRVYRILRRGEVRVNKARVKPEYKLKLGDQVRIPPVRVSEAPVVPTPSQSLWQHLNRSVLLETDSVMVINKPAGMAVHGGDGIELGLIEAMRQVRSDCRYLELVHRLDKDTSGCVMLAKKRSALKILQNKLRSGKGIQKRYLALVIGHWPNRLSNVDQPLKRLELPDGNRIVKVKPDGKPSQTRFRVVERFDHSLLGSISLVEAQPVTGRTHQIRVHAQFSGYPLLADTKYGDDVINKQASQLGPIRLCLHAEGLCVEPDAEFEGIDVVAPLLPDLQALLKKLRQEG